MIDSKSLDQLIEVAKLGGRLDLLREIKVWLDMKMVTAQNDHEKLTKEVDDGRTDILGQPDTERAS